MFNINHNNNLDALFPDFHEAELDDNLLGGESLHNDSEYKTIDSENTLEGDIDLLELQFKHLTAKRGSWDSIHDLKYTFHINVMLIEGISNLLHRSTTSVFLIGAGSDEDRFASLLCLNLL